MRHLRFLPILALLLGAPTVRADFINGNFQTGSLAPWTPYTTASGTAGSGLPNVVSFNTTGGGASLAAHFNVGVSNSAATGTQQGSGLIQSLSLTGGLYSISANVAAALPSSAQNSNGEGGVFTLLIDGVARASVSFGDISPSQVLRGSLDATVNLAAGIHEFRFLVTRRFLSISGVTPDQYIDNITIAPTPVPEPTSLAMLGLGLAGAGVLARSRRRA